MSIRQINLVLHGVGRTLPDGEFRLLAYLADKADDAGGGIFASPETLATWTGLTRSYVLLSLRRFIGRGWLHKTETDHGRATYRLSLPLANSDEHRERSQDRSQRSQDRRLQRSQDRRRAIPGSPSSDPRIADTPIAVSATAHTHASSVTETSSHPSSYTSIDPGTYARTPEVLPPEGVRAHSGAGATAEPRAQAPTPDVRPPDSHRSPFETNARRRLATLVVSPRALSHYAYPNPVVGVPMIAHARYIDRLVNAGVERRGAEQQLFEWYETVIGQWSGQRIGDRELAFWDKRFEEWQGITASTATQTSSVGATNAAYVARRRAEQGRL